ncbi:MAG: SGNH/GDSL hydrolase family protein [Candidatus Acidiferrales bacterium]
MIRRFGTLALFGSLAVAATAMVAQCKSGPSTHWVATWAAAQQMALTTPDRPILSPDIKRPVFRGAPGARGARGARGPRSVPTISNDHTVRMIVHTSIGGKSVRIELANSFGKKAVSFGNAHIAVRTTGSSIDASTDRQLTFSTSKSVDLQPGAVIVSDPVDLNVKPMSDLAISLYVVDSEDPPTIHDPGLHTTYISSGDTAASASTPDATTNTAYLWLRSVDVDTSAGDFGVACLGDSITDGFRTTVNADQAWPTLLAKRLSEKKGGPRIAVLNEGISGNEVLRDGAGVSALGRFDRDILAEPGLRWVVLLEGINDINIHGQISGPGGMTAEDLIQGYLQLIARAHMDGLKIMGATLTPDGGLWMATPVGEATRQKVNDWIKTSGKFDAVVDLDAAVRDKAAPTHMRADFDSGDHIHPNDPGNAAMANAFDLAVFTR